jgi:two-component system chemotaxis response regulator CheY
MLQVLIADDSLIIRKKITKILEKLGHTVVFSATNGQEAIDGYQAHRPDLVTMDITMPDMDGITAVKHIIAEDKSAKIIMVTSHGQEDMVIKSIQNGAVGYILKPISDEKMAQAIGEVFEEYASLDEDDELDFLDEEH